MARVLAMTLDLSQHDAISPRSPRSRSRGAAPALGWSERGREREKRARGKGARAESERARAERERGGQRASAGRKARTGARRAGERARAEGSGGGGKCASSGAKVSERGPKGSRGGSRKAGHARKASGGGKRATGESGPRSRVPRRPSATLPTWFPDRARRSAGSSTEPIGRTVVEASRVCGRSGLEAATSKAPIV